MNITPVNYQNPSFNALANMGPATKCTSKGKEVIKKLMLNTDHIVSAESIPSKISGHFAIRVKTVLNDIYELSYPIKSCYSNVKDRNFDDFVRELNDLPKEIRTFDKHSEPILR